MADRDERLTLAPRRSVFGVVREYPFVFVAAALLGAAAVGAVLYLAGGFFADEEAPIRVRNGSLQFIIERPGDEWTPSGSSGNYRYRDGEKHSDDYDVIVVPAGSHTCNLYSKTGSNIEFTYSDEKTITVQSQGRNTWVKPGTGVTLTLNNASMQTLTYTATGYLSKVAVGNQTLCTFTSGAQLSSVLIVDVP
jgi:hypothetical protein